MSTSRTSLEPYRQNFGKVETDILQPRQRLMQAMRDFGRKLIMLLRSRIIPMSKSVLRATQPWVHQVRPPKSKRWPAHQVPPLWLFSVVSCQGVYLGLMSPPPPKGVIRAVQGTLPAWLKCAKGGRFYIFWDAKRMWSSLVVRLTVTRPLDRPLFSES